MAPPDLTLLAITHRVMRHDANRLHRAVQQMHEGERHGRGVYVRQWFHGFEGEVRAHHAFEDTILLPHLVKRAPTAFVQVARIDQDHRALADALEACAYSLGELADPMVEWVSARGWALAATSALEQLLADHLDFTDRVIVPAISHYFSEDAYAALEADAKAFRSLRQAMFSVPWILTSVTSFERAQLLDGAPRVVRVLWRLTNRGHRRLAERALAIGSGACAAAAA